MNPDSMCKIYCREISQAVKQDSAAASEAEEQEISQAIEHGATAAETEKQEISQPTEQEGALAAETEEQAPCGAGFSQEHEPPVVPDSHRSMSPLWCRILTGA
ncbi:hypothetical protein P7K49_035134 [Saguinus oedipus]|uniref:Uncharacterized protein n=1 Tax=Saguinus oedipus TaxID=9490 RepID=A0ABQ9TYH4_SAGOE|nr:hypothetical protein P7K49_035134 [Saguinus oedipus]